MPYLSSLLPKVHNKCFGKLSFFYFFPILPHIFLICHILQAPNLVFMSESLRGQ